MEKGEQVSDTPRNNAANGPHEQLQRMKQREAAIWRELEIYMPLVARLKTAASDLDEAIKALEKGVEEQALEDHEASACAAIQDERRDG